MNICTPKESRPFEFRVGITPVIAKLLVQNGHTVYVEHEAGERAGFSDQDYEQSGARIAYSSHEVFGRADLLLKVARPTCDEVEWLHPEATMMGLLHLGSSTNDVLDLLREKKVTTISYEHISAPGGDVPVRTPLSQIGGTLAAQITGRLLQSNHGGKGILIGGSPSIPPAEVVVIGAGVFGTAAIKAFVGMGAHVSVLDTNMEALQRTFDRYSCCVTMIAHPFNIERAVAYADVVVSSVLVPGQRPPLVVTRAMVRSMKPRSVIVDASIDEGGSVETARPTTHEKPTYVEEGMIHYCVPNIPSAVARTSTYAFLNAALPYILELSNKGVDQALAENPFVKQAVAFLKGEDTHLIAMPQKMKES